MTIDFPKRSRRLASLILGYTAVPSEASTTSRVARIRAVVLRDFPLSLDGIQCVPSGSFSALADCGLHRLRGSGLWILKNFWSYFHLVKQILVKPAPVKPAPPTPRTDLTKKLLHLGHALQVSRWTLAEIITKSVTLLHAPACGHHGTA